MFHVADVNDQNGVIKVDRGNMVSVAPYYIGGLGTAIKWSPHLSLAAPIVAPYHGIAVSYKTEFSRRRCEFQKILSKLSKKLV